MFFCEPRAHADFCESRNPENQGLDSLRVVDRIKCGMTFELLFLIERSKKWQTLHIDIQGQGGIKEGPIVEVNFLILASVLIAMN